MFVNRVRELAFREKRYASKQLSLRSLRLCEKYFQVRQMLDKYSSM